MNDNPQSNHLVLLPGMMCDERLYKAQVNALDEQYNVAVLPITDHDTIQALAADALARAPQRFALAGLSMGGIVALEMWRQAPHRIQKLALLDTNFRAEMPERQAQREPQVAAVMSGGLEKTIRQELFPQYLAASHADDQALEELIVDMGLRLGREVFARQSFALRDRPDSADTLATIDCPTLVLCGDEDRLCSPELHEEMASRIAPAELQIIAKCGHLSTLDQPDATCEALRIWLKRE